MSDTPKRRWFHFSIRDLMWLTVLVALVLGGWVEGSRLQRENWRLTRENAALQVNFQDEHDRRLAASSEAKLRRELEMEL